MPTLNRVTCASSLCVVAAHRVQSAAVAYALRAQSFLLFFVSLAMVQAAAMHFLAHHHGLFRHGDMGDGDELDGLDELGAGEEELAWDDDGRESYLYEGAT